MMPAKAAARGVFSVLRVRDTRSRSWSRSLSTPSLSQVEVTSIWDLCSRSSPRYLLQGDVVSHLFYDL